MDLVDQLHDRAHELGKRIVNACAPTNPMRSPSTRDMIVKELEPLEQELAAVVALLHMQACQNRRAPSQR